MASSPQTTADEAQEAAMLARLEAGEIFEDIDNPLVNILSQKNLK